MNGGGCRGGGSCRGGGGGGGGAKARLVLRNKAGEEEGEEEGRVKGGKVSLTTYNRPSPVAQSVAFALPKTDCCEDLD